jgi:hypothetical protein
MAEESAPEEAAPDPQFTADVRRIFEDPALHRVLAYVRAKIRMESETSEPHEKDLREHCYYLLNAVVRIEKRLRAVADGGKLTLVRRERARGGDAPAA